MDRDNLRERGAIEKCLCPCQNWLNFCSPIETEDDMKFIGFNPLPYDTRCGCVLCWECKPGVPCSECTGCNVCRGPLDPCPKDLDTPWSLPAAEMRALFSCAQRGDFEGMQAAIAGLHERGETFNPNASLGGATLLTLVAQSGSVPCLGLLQRESDEEGACALDANKRNPNGDAALMLAIVQDHQPMVEALLKIEHIDSNPELVRISPF